jgi:hypothetical protein
MLKLEVASPAFSLYLFGGSATPSCNALQIDSGSPSISAEGKKCKILTDRLEFTLQAGSR